MIMTDPSPNERPASDLQQSVRAGTSPPICPQNVPSHRPPTPLPLANKTTTTINDLVNFYFAAQQSLSSHNVVQQAEKIDKDAKLLAELIVKRTAQTEFIHAGLQDAVAFLVPYLNDMYKGLNLAREDAVHTLRELDEANALLDDSLAALRSTFVDKAFRPAGEDSKTLMDFVEENTVENTRQHLKACIDELEVTKETYTSELALFEADIRTVRARLTPKAQPPEPASKLISAIESNSMEMANILQRLIQHYDKCVAAVCMSEGAAELVRLRIADKGGDLSGTILDRFDCSTTQDRLPDLELLAAEAATVDGMVARLSEQLAEMEADIANMRSQRTHAKTDYDDVVAVHEVLDHVGKRLPACINARDVFRERWGAAMDVIRAGLGQMHQLRVVYESYGVAYDELVLETERRRNAELAIRNVWLQAADATRKLAEEEMHRRHVFMQDIGDHLPTDLWLGIHDPVRQWRVVPAGAVAGVGTATGGATVGADPTSSLAALPLAYSSSGGAAVVTDPVPFAASLPQLSRSTIEASRARLNLLQSRRP